MNWLHQTRPIRLDDYLAVIFLCIFAGWVFCETYQAIRRLRNATKELRRDCCDELIHAAMNVESNVIVDGFTIQCAECLTWWRFIQGGAVWWERIDTNERRAVELREEQGIQVCGLRWFSGKNYWTCNLPRGHSMSHQCVRAESGHGNIVWSREHGVPSNV